MEIETVLSIIGCIIVILIIGLILGRYQKNKETDSMSSRVYPAIREQRSYANRSPIETKSTHLTPSQQQYMRSRSALYTHTRSNTGVAPRRNIIKHNVRTQEQQIRIRQGKQEGYHPLPSYTVGYQRSAAEQNAQIQSISHYANHPEIRQQAQQAQRYQPIQVDRHQQQPFPAGSYETTDMSCVNGGCADVSSTTYSSLFA